MILSLCKVQTVSFYKLSTAFESGSEALSCMRRIQRFMSSYALDFDLIARLIMLLLPHKGPYTLSMDRTNWKFGNTDINALVVGITYEGIALPILFRLLPKRGNSNTQERIEIIDRFIKLFTPISWTTGITIGTGTGMTGGRVGVMILIIHSILLAYILTVQVLSQ